jgi:hypothetical protein
MIETNDSYRKQVALLRAKLSAALSGLFLQQLATGGLRPRQNTFGPSGLVIEYVSVARWLGWRID